MIKEKKEIRPTWFLISEFLEWKFGLMFFGHINKFEVGVMYILCKEAGYEVIQSDWKSIDMLLEGTRIMTPIIIGPEDKIKEINY